MHSLFGGRKSSTNLNAAPSSRSPHQTQYDEFGASSSTYNPASGVYDSPLPPPTPSKTARDSQALSQKEKDKASRKRAISSSAGGGISSADLPSSYYGSGTMGAGGPGPGGAMEGPLGAYAHLPDGEFFPTIIPPKKPTSLPEYGYISSEADIILSLDDVMRLVTVVDRELSTRGLKEPFLFSTKALDVSSARVRSLVGSFVSTCEPSNLHDYPGARRLDPRDIHIANTKFQTEAGFAGPHELAMLLKWGLARIVRAKNGYETRGFLDLDDYVTWRAQEEASGYPPNHFPTLFHLIPKATHPLLDTLLSLFSRFCANSSFSGLTPPALSSYFGPLMFGLGPSSLPFGPTYKLFLRSVHATEHLFLAYIQNSDYELPLGVELPTKLKGWIKGYPKMLPRSPEGMESPRPNQRMVTVASVRRNVRLYSTDLVSTATTWCTTGEHTSKSEWTRTVPSSSGEYSKPQYTDDYKKQLNLPKGAEPKLHYDGGLRPGMPTPMAGVPSSPAYRNPIDDAIARSHPELSSTSSLTSSTTSNEERYKNLADLQWSQFSESGFKAPDSKLLQFDLGETARRNARNPKKRETVNWNDFALAGFDRPPSKAPLLGEGGRPDTPIGGKDGPLPLLPLDPLAEVLQFSVPLERPDAWTDHSAEITRKLRKQQKALPNFGWETTAISGRNWVVEESMIAAWAELCLSSGWMDRGEGTFRESNWVLIEFKAIPIDPSTARPSSREGSDPRTSGQWYLVEEFIPREYRDDLQHPKKKKNPLFASLTPKSKKWTSAATVNGHPYTGRPRSPDPRDYEFDAVIRNSSSTTKLTLGSGGGQPPAKQPELNRVATPTRDTSSAAVFARPKPVRAKTGGDAPPETPSKAISAPLFVPPRGDSLGSGSGLRPMPAPVSAPAATLSQPDASPPETPSKSSMGISSPALGPKITNSFARLKPGRRTGQTPAEWDASIEFEARSESDSDEGDATRASGPNVPPKDGAKRLSKQDPWVDIVVRNPDEQNGSIGRVSGSGPHHQNGADSGDSGHARYDNSSDGHGMDPERAQAEIDQVMRGIPRLSDGPEDITPRRSLDDDEVVRPRHRPTGRADADEVGVPSGLVHRRAATDLRAPKSREELAAASPTSPDASTPNRAARLPLPTSPYPPGRSPPPGAAPAVRQLPTIPPAPQTASPTSPVASPPPRSSSVPQGRNGNGSGVSSLVNMYQNKEAAALATIPPALLPKSQQSPSTAAAAGGNGLPESPAAARSLPSTPARPSAIPVPVGSQKPPALAAPTPHNAVAETSSIITDASGESIEPLDPPQPIFEPPRVPSPARYVHGAPLTNVLEEEEEE